MNIEALQNQLIKHEGIRLSPYRDTVGKLTIGVGRCLDTNPLTPVELDYIGHDCRTHPITREQALYLLQNDIKKASAEVQKYLPWFNSLDEIRQRVIIDMVFNLGIAGFMAFKNTISLIHSGQYEAASYAMLGSKWAQQVKTRATDLATMMRTGVAC